MKIIKKTITTLLVVLFVSACSKYDPIEIDENAWGYSFNQNQLSGSLAGLREATESPNGIYFKMNVKVPSERATAYILGYVDKDTGLFNIVDSNLNSRCSVENYAQCSSYLENGIENLNYYNGYLFGVEQSLNSETGVLERNLVQMDLDATNRRMIKKIETTGDMFSILFHEGNVFYSGGSTNITKLDLRTGEAVVVNIEKSNGFNIINAINNKLYFGTATYYDGNDVHNYVLVEYNFDSKDFQIVHDQETFQFRDGSYVYFDRENMTMRLFNENEDIDVLLQQDSGGPILTSEYIISTTAGTSEAHDIYLFNRQGEILGTYDNTESNSRFSHFSQVIDENYLYLFRHFESKDEFVRIKYSEGTLEELEVLAEWAR